MIRSLLIGSTLRFYNLTPQGACLPEARQDSSLLMCLAVFCWLDFILEAFEMGGSGGYEAHVLDD